MTEPEQKTLIEMPTEDQVKDAEASFILDVFNRLLAGRSMSIIMSVIASLLYNIAKDMSPQVREFLSTNLVRLTQDILNLDNEFKQPEESQPAAKGH